MVQLGYAISSEEFAPNELVRNAQKAEATGFPYALISDHYHPWIDAQGHAPFVWNVIGGIAQATSTLMLGTGVTCPTVRIHPAIIAQAAATSAAMMPGRFFLGLGTGENLNEHILGQHWPPISVRLEMLRESVDVMRTLWGGGYVTQQGRFYTVENARIYTLPDGPIPVYLAASGPEAATLAGEIGDGLIDTSPSTEVTEAFDAAGGTGKPRYGQLTMCWAKDEETAKKTAHHYWRYTVLGGQLSQELALPKYFDDASKDFTPAQVAEKVVCGPDPAPLLEKIGAFTEAGFTHVYLHQVGPDQDGFFDFVTREIMPNVGA